MNRQLTKMETPEVTDLPLYIPELVDLISTDEELEPHLAILEKFDTPIAVDTERASGFLYNQRPYLIQLASEETGVLLIDPTTLSSRAIEQLGRALARHTWVLHSASGDLASVKLIGLTPTRIFDTELSARLLGYERVSLGALVEDVLDVRLAKDHGHSDWSTRPLPASWLSYAAGDVEFLVRLSEKLRSELIQSGRDSWAEQEFTWLLNAPAPLPKPDPWRGTKNIHMVSSPRGLAVVQHLWGQRENLGKELDLSPHRILRDQEISAIASLAGQDHLKKSRNLLKRKKWGKFLSQAHIASFYDALDRVEELSTDELPSRRRLSTDIPPPSTWMRKKPQAAKLWGELRPTIKTRSEELGVAMEILITSAILKTFLWNLTTTDEESVRSQLMHLHVRPWQCDIVVPILVDHLNKSDLVTEDSPPHDPLLPTL
ncbi:MAG: hypothetical protein FWG15_04570 [Propionibacteriaceae bacterium]|nr:hypothetical protein [Propionibacteriaceae bacterium]